MMLLPSVNLRIERWKFNAEYGVYVSTLGHFKDRQKRNLSYKINQRSGYCCIQTEQGLVTAHRLVLLTWRPIPNREVMTVDHLNHNKRDNSLMNLEWVSREENISRAKRDLCSFDDGYATESKSKTFDLLKCNGMIMTADQAITFLTYGKSDDDFEQCVREFVLKFLKNNNPNARKLMRYGYCWEKV